MNAFLVQATLGQNTSFVREYTHYICKEEHNAIRLAAILRIKRPELNPITVVSHTLDDNRSVRWADDSQGPK